MSPQREQILRELGIGPQWRLRAANAEPEVLEQAHSDESVAPRPAVEGRPQRLAMPAVAEAREITSTGSSVDASGMSWADLATGVAECRACALCTARKQAVLGVGDQQADWLFVGEGPGAEEDERGEPFVGQAGKLLDAMLEAIDLKRGENVYIANSVKCRPPNNRTPEPEETAACRPWLERQIELLQPKLIVALGRPAAQTLLQREVKIGAVRGQLFDYKGIPLIVTYHPAYLLRNLSDKARAWEDLCFARKTMG